jgi:hypothetical protein
MAFLSAVQSNDSIWSSVNKVFSGTRRGPWNIQEIPEESDKWHSVDQNEPNKGKYRVTEYGIHNPSASSDGNENLWFFFGFMFSPAEPTDVDMSLEGGEIGHSTFNGDSPKSWCEEPEEIQFASGDES